MTKDTTLGQRIKLARKAASLTQVELAKRVEDLGQKVSQQTILGYEQNKRGTEHPNLALLINIAKVLNVSLDWILTGKGEGAKKDSQNNAENYPTIKYYAPVIDWHEIHLWKTKRNSMHLEGKDHIPLLNGEGSNCFGLRIKEDSMCSSDSEDTFKQGDVVIVNPDIKIGIGDYVVISLGENEPALLRQFTMNSDGTFFRALNTGYPDIKATDKIYTFGVVIGKYTQFTR